MLCVGGISFLPIHLAMLKVRVNKFSNWIIYEKTDFSKNCQTDIFDGRNKYKGKKDNVCVNDSNLFLNKWLISKFNKSQKNNYACANTNHGNDLVNKIIFGFKRM